MVMFVAIIAGKTLYTLRASLSLSSSNDVSADTVDDVGSFEFLLKLSSHHPYTFTPPLQQTLTQQHRVSHNYFSIPKTF